MHTRRLSKLQLDDYGYNALGDYVDRNRLSIAINLLRHNLADEVVYRLGADARRLIASPRAVERWLALMRYHVCRRW